MIESRNASVIISVLFLGIGFGTWPMASVSIADRSSRRCRTDAEQEGRCQWDLGRIITANETALRQNADVWNGRCNIDVERFVSFEATRD